MLSSFGKGFAIALLWLFLGCLYQSYIRQNACLVDIGYTVDRKKSLVVKPKKFKPKKFKAKKLRRKKMVLNLDNIEVTQAKDLEMQLNQLSIEVIDLKMRQGIPNGYK